MVSEMGWSWVVVPDDLVVGVEVVEDGGEVFGFAGGFFGEVFGVRNG